MKVTEIKDLIPVIVSYLFILLFVYAAVSKLVDFENFEVQIAQSPLLTAFAAIIPAAVIIVEVFLSVSLSIAKTRVIGLYGAFALMALFSIYIVIILNYSPFIPCSCGGVLEDMGWVAHLYFNLGFTALAVIGLWLLRDRHKKSAYNVAMRLAAITFLSIVLMVALFLSSEDIVTKRNDFVRRFPPFPAKRSAGVDLQFDSYYFAGEHNGSIFLGNRTAPATITVLDTSLQIRERYQINITDTLFTFRNVQLRVVQPHFYLYDGTVPVVFKGKLADGKAILQSKTIPGFTKAVVVDSANLIVRTLSAAGEHLLSKVALQGDFRKDNPDLLEKQIDGVFDTDGILHYSHEKKLFVYLYYYRNQYIVADDDLQLQHRGHTIDTNTRAKIETKYVAGRKQEVFSAPPQMVNRISALKGNLLFVNSVMRGKYDTNAMWRNAHYIDVYDIAEQKYLLSFYVYNNDGDRIDDMIVTATHLVAIMGSKAITYRFHKTITDKLK